MAGKYAVAASAILRPKRWVGRFFVGRPSARDVFGDIGSAVSVLPSGTPSMFYCLIFPRLSSHISSAVLIIVSFLFYCTHFLPFPSSGVSFVVPIVPPLCNIYCAAVLIAPQHHHGHQPASIPPFGSPCNPESPPHIHPPLPSPSSRHI